MYVKIVAMKKIIVLFLAVIFSSVVFAQSADVITELLETEKATYGEVCYLSAVQQKFLDDSASYEEAISVLRSEGQLAESVDADTPIKAIEAASLFASMWNIEGGLMYRMTKGAPRYAFKQFQSDGIISSVKDPSSYVSGTEILKMYTACVKKYSDFNMNNVSLEAE